MESQKQPTIEEELSRMMDAYLKCVMRDLIELRENMERLKERAGGEVKRKEIPLGANLYRLVRLTTAHDAIHTMIAVVQAQAQLLAAHEIVGKELFDLIRRWGSGKE